MPNATEVTYNRDNQIICFRWAEGVSTVFYRSMLDTLSATLVRDGSSYILNNSDPLRTQFGIVFRRGRVPSFRLIRDLATMTTTVEFILHGARDILRPSSAPLLPLRRIRGGFLDDETAYRAGVIGLSVWCASTMQFFPEGSDINKLIELLGNTFDIRQSAEKAISEGLFANYSRQKAAEEMLRYVHSAFTANGLQDFTNQSLMQRRFVNLFKNGQAVSTRNRHIAVWNRFAKWVNDQQLSVPPLATLKYVKEDNRRVVWLTEDNIAAAMIGLENKPNDIMWFRFMLYTGARVSEVANLEWKDVSDAAVTFWDTKGGDNNARTLPLDGFDCSLWVWAKAVGRDTLKGPFSDYTTAKVSALWAELRRDGYMSKDFTPHTLRHTCATRLLAKGVAITTIKEWLGHKSLRMTMRYAHLNPEALRDAARLNTVAQPPIQPPPPSDVGECMCESCRNARAGNTQEFVFPDDWLADPTGPTTTTVGSTDWNTIGIVEAA